MATISKAVLAQRKKWRDQKRAYRAKLKKVAKQMAHK